jgi:Bacterial transcriptional activator domain
VPSTQLRSGDAAAILTTEAGYALAAGPGEVDIVRFEQLVAKGQRLAADGEMEPASAALGEALGLRRGEPLAEFTYAGFFDAEPRSPLRAWRTGVLR